MIDKGEFPLLNNFYWMTYIQTLNGDRPCRGRAERP